MRWGWIGAVVLLVGCSRDNPWFHVGGEDDTPSASTSAADESGTTGPAASTSPIDSTASTGPADSSGDTGSVVETGTDTGSDDTTTGEAQGTTTDAPDTTDTGDDDTTTGADPTEGDVWHDLWLNCWFPTTNWLAEGPMKGSVECSTDGDHPATRWAGYYPAGLYANQWVFQVLALAPEFGANTTMTGTYTGLTMPNAKNPHLRTTVVCPTDPPACLIQGNIRVERNAESIVGVENFKLSAGAAFNIDIDLEAYPELLDGEPFSVVLVVTSLSTGFGNRGLWLAPRIVEVNP